MPSPTPESIYLLTVLWNALAGLGAFAAILASFVLDRRYVRRLFHCFIGSKLSYSLLLILATRRNGASSSS